MHVVAKSNPWLPNGRPQKDLLSGRGSSPGVGPLEGWARSTSLYGSVSSSQVTSNDVVVPAPDKRFLSIERVYAMLGGRRSGVLACAVPRGAWRARHWAADLASRVGYVVG